MEWYAFDTWIVLTGALSAGACALVGSFLVLRRMSMMGDAISHAVLPGLAVAFLVTGARSSWVMFVGAAAIGLLTAVGTEWLHRKGRMDEGASMGIVFTTFFALGLVLIARAADRVDLDPECVLYGALELTPLDTVALALPFFGEADVPRAFLVLLAVFVLNLLAVVVFFKELRLVCFDPALAATLGFGAKRVHYGLMTLVAVTTVASFEAVGSILVIAMLIVPAATARLLTDRLSGLLVGAVLLAFAAAAVGHLAAITVPGWFGFTDTSTAGTMAFVTGLFFLGAAGYASLRHRLHTRARAKAIATL